MKKSSLLKRTLMLTFVLASFLKSGYAQVGEWQKAYSTGIIYHTTPGNIFTWSGGSKDGYSDGFGTIQFYDKSGNPGSKYVGNVRRGKNEGYGIMYYPNGDIYYKGFWVNDKIRDLQNFEAFGSAATAYIVKNAFDGGTNVQYKIIKLMMAYLHNFFDGYHYPPFLEQEK